MGHNRSFATAAVAAPALLGVAALAWFTRSADWQPVTVGLCFGAAVGLVCTLVAGPHRHWGWVLLAGVLAGTALGYGLVSVDLRGDQDSTDALIGRTFMAGILAVGCALTSSVVLMARSVRTARG